jgi:hypothetical protein
MPIPSGRIFATFKGCGFFGEPIIGIATFQRPQFLNCRFSGAGAIGIVVTAIATVRSGLLLGARLQLNGGQPIFDNDFMVQGNRISVQNSAPIFGTTCVFDAVGDAFTVGSAEPPCAMVSSTQLSGAHQLWGAGNTGVGMRLGGGSQFMYVTTIPTVTGAGGDFILAGAASSRAWDEAVSAYTALIPNSWVTLAAAIGAGGFGGSAHNVERNAHIVRG